MAKGMFEMNYGPLDCVLFHGNWPHGVSTLRPFTSEGQKKAEDGKWELERFSLIIFCRFGHKGVQGHGKYNGTWRKEWKKEIDTIAKMGNFPKKRGQKKS